MKSTLPQESQKWSKSVNQRIKSKLSKVIPTFDLRINELN